MKHERGKCGEIDAELIVRAVNSFAAMREALEAYVDSSADSPHTIDDARAMAEKALALARQNMEIEQIAGKVLGYPWFKDDQKNFPGATEKDGVCVGDHVAESIVQELANRYTQLEADKAELVAALRNVSIFGKLHCDTCKQMVDTLLKRIGGGR